MHLEPLLDALLEKNAEALCLRSGKAPVYCLSDRFDRQEGQPLTAGGLDAAIEKITPDHASKRLETEGSVVFGWQDERGRRFKISVARTGEGIEVLFYPISRELFGFDQLGVPKPSLLPCLEARQGLVLISGSVRSGRSTSLAAIVNWINEHREAHIVTLEDPIEQKHDDKRAMVSQRELHAHFPTMAEGIQSALRQGADVIVAGALGGPEAVEAAIEAASLGRLVFGALTGDATGAIGQIVDSMPVERRESLRVRLSQCLLGVIGQKLMPRASGHGRVAAYEILVNSPAVAATIRGGKLDRLMAIIQTSAKFGMITLDDYLLMLYRKNVIAADVCRENSINPIEMRRNMFGEGLTGRNPDDDPDDGAPTPVLA